MGLATGIYMLPATFKGVPFLYSNSSTQGGRKFVKFEYANKDTRNMEDLGRLQRIYDVEAIIQGDDVEYPIFVKLFQDVLDSEGAGILTHPTDGFVRVFPSPYTLDESFAHVGVAKFKLKFFEVGTQTFPTPINVLSAAAQIAQTALGVITVLSQNFASGWNVSGIFPQVTEAASQFASNLGDQFATFASNMSDNSEGLTTFNNDLDNYNNNISSNVLDGSNYSDSANTVFESYGNIATTPTDQSSLIELFFPFETPTTLNISPTTVPTDQIEKNRLLLDQYINAQALIYDYIFSTQITYATEKDVTDKSDLLTNQFAYIIENNNFTDLTGNESQLLDDDTLKELENLRSSAHTYLNNQKATSKKIIPIRTSNDSLLDLTFRYYGSLDEYDTISNLNDLAYRTNINGALDIVSDAD